MNELGNWLIGHQMWRSPTVQCRTVVVTLSPVMMIMTVNEEVVTDVELSVVSRRPTRRHSYTATPLPPPAGNIGSTADCRQIPEHRNSSKYIICTLPLPLSSRRTSFSALTVGWVI